MQSLRRLDLPTAGLTALGAVLGILAKVADESSLAWASAVGDHPGVWIVAIALIGRLSATAARAGGRAGLFSLAMCLGYYGWSIGVLGFGWGPFVFAWLVLAVTAAPGAAAAVWWASQRRGALPGLVLGLLGGLVLSGGALRGVLLAARGHLPAFAARPGLAAVELVMVLLIVVAVPREVATRWWAAALLVPAWWLPDLVSWFVGLFG